MRQLGLYHEEFSIIYSLEEENKVPVKYKMIDKHEINEVISGGNGTKEIIKKWQLLMIDHEPMQVSQMTLECI